MAQGDVTIFQQFIEDVGNGAHDLDGNSIKMGLIDSVQTPTAGATDPRWGAGGTVNYDTNEVTQTGGNYAAEGLDITATWSQAAGTGTFDATDVSTWTSDPSNPDDAKWGIIYNATSAGKECIAYLDLGTEFDMTTGDLNVAWHANGIFTLTIT